MDFYSALRYVLSVYTCVEEVDGKTSGTRFASTFHSELLIEIFIYEKHNKPPRNRGGSWALNNRARKLCFLRLIPRP